MKREEVNIVNKEEMEGQMKEEAGIYEKGLSSEKPLPKLMVFFCYITALMLVIAIVYGFTGIVSDIINKATNFQVDRFKILTYVGVFYLMWSLMINLGDYWRASEKNEIGTAVTNLPNPFYDPGFSKGPLVLRIKYRELLTQFKYNKSLLKRSQQNVKSLGEAIGKFESKLRVLLRHNDNANRLIKSMNYLFASGETQFIEKMLNHILAECITVLEKDQSDKSISLFQVRADTLVIKESVRINAESVAKRVFKKGEGYAGYIWGIGKAEIVNHINEGDIRFSDGGLPATPIGLY